MNNNSNSNNRTKQRIRLITNTSLYVGEVERPGSTIPSGLGRWRPNLEEKQLFVGNFERGLLHGKGFHLCNDGAIEEGEFVRGQLDGKGIRIEKDGIETFEGEFCNGRRHGVGIYTDKDGSRYEGARFANNWPNGNGGITSYQDYTFGVEVSLTPVSLSCVWRPFIC